MPESGENLNFDDPSLKTAVRKVWCAEQCPVALRAKILAAKLGAVPSAGHIFWGRSRAFYGLAAAAVVLVAMGITVYFVFASANPIPSALADALVVRHNGCCAAPDHHMPGLPQHDFAAIGRGLQRNLGFAILSAPLPGQWDFRGAAICPVGGVKSGHLVFEHVEGQRKQFVSIFSLPRSAAQNAMPTGPCAEMAKGEAIAGLVMPGGIYCLVGSSNDKSLTLTEVESLRDQLQGKILALSTSASSYASLTQ
jgi:hypothetical protein